MSVKQSWLINFPYERPPLTSNQRMHWGQKMTLTRKVRRVAAKESAHIPALGKCRVQLVWLVLDNRRRDVDNVVPTLKAMCDGLVDAGLVPDDTPEYMMKLMPVIHKVDREFGPAKLQLIIEEM
ncbi:crossover junction endodeoxyribonuclease RusA [Aurantimicrobium minutum]|nr:crossover junction endodeoxyribonuclease RusA [Aurantimicrobium minutum]